MARISHKKFTSLTPEDLGKMNKEEVNDLLQDARKKLATRLKTFSKQGRYFYSPAERIINDYYKENPEVPIDTIERNRALNEIFKIQDFFKAKTGSLKGARDVMRKQDIRIFGESKSNPRLSAHKLTKDQRDAFWAAYNEFKQQKKNAIERFGSDPIIQFLGEMVTAKEGRVLDYKEPGFFDAVYSVLNERKYSIDSSDIRNVLTGSSAEGGPENGSRAISTGTGTASSRRVSRKNRKR